MTYYLVYERCEGCANGNCFQCILPGRRLTLRIVQADSPPENSIDGPAEAPQEFIAGMADYFAWDEEKNEMYFRWIKLQ